MKFTIKLSIFAFLICISCQQVSNAQTLVLDSKALAKNRQLITENNPEKKAALKSLLNAADKIVKKGKFYSVMDKKKTPPSGDKHDYMSQAPYWWADSTKPNGLPYIRRDGEVNPEYHDITDAQEENNLEADVRTTALAYYFSKEERYAEHAAKLIKTWFLDKNTRQNPNLNFSQGIPGINTGRGIGIIETRGFYEIMDGAILLRGSKFWSDDDHIALKKWFSEYLTWLLESPIGKDEAAEHNNHGTYYDVQVVATALFVGKSDLAKTQLDTTKKRIESQLKPDGSQPHELARTKSWDYTNMNLLGFCILARLAENVATDLWYFETKDGKNIKNCVNWLMPYLKNEKKWTEKQIKKITYEQTILILKMATKAYFNPKYDDLAKAVDAAVYQSYFYQLAF